MDQRWDDAMALALDMAAKSPCPDPNPRVGCVIVAEDRVIGQGWHRGAGTPHAEVEALRQAGDDAREPPPSSPWSPVITPGVPDRAAMPWSTPGLPGLSSPSRIPTRWHPGRTVAAYPRRRGGHRGSFRGSHSPQRRLDLQPDPPTPRVCWKYAASLDGRSAAPDGTSQWITGEQARHQVQLGRARCGAIIVGTGTALADNPRLTVRLPGVTHQPLRVVVGMREPPAGCHLRDDSASTLHIPSHDPAEVLDLLWCRGVHRVWLEGGPQLAGAFLAANLVDEVIAHMAPTVLGDGRAAVVDPTVATLSQAHHFVIDDVTQLGPDIQIHAHHE